MLPFGETAEALRRLLVTAPKRFPCNIGADVVVNTRSVCSWRDASAMTHLRLATAARARVCVRIWDAAELVLGAVRTVVTS